jgi:hypothetical protein
MADELTARPVSIGIRTQTEPSPLLYEVYHAES